MPVTAAAMQPWCQSLLGVGDVHAPASLEEMLEAVPRLDALSDAPPGTAVLVRGDLDAKPGAEVGQGDIRLRSMKETLEVGRRRGWKQILFGHVGRDPELSLRPVQNRLAQILGRPIAFFENWLDEETLTINPKLAAGIEKSPPGTLIMLENTRRYQIERALWKASEADLAALAEPLARLANEFSQKVARVYVHEAFAAGSLDASSTVLPAAMDRVALGIYTAGQFDGPVRQCRNASLVVFSGLKIDKLDDLQAIVDRGAVRWVISAGSLAMALRKAAAQLDGGDFHLGVAEDESHRDKPYYIPPRRIEQARQMIAEGRQRRIRFVPPADFVLADGQVAESLGPADQQFDVGPASNKAYESAVGEYIQAANAGDVAPVAFHNGVFGMFEDQRFEEGTRRFVAQLKRMREQGVEVYVGGGEGGKALERYGRPDWVTHVFTAGGTVLNALGNEPVPYLLALQMAASS